MSESQFVVLRPVPSVLKVSQESVRRFQTPSAKRAWWQVANSFVPYLLLWIAMVYAYALSYWLMLPLAIVAAGFLARIFIIFHDCTHASFFKSLRANQSLGVVAGLLNLTPYRYWQWQHALHHGSSGDLDRRGAGDIWTLTVDEFAASTRWTQIAYRLARNPAVLFVLAPLYVFVVHHRLPASAAPRRERRSVLRTNVALVCASFFMCTLVGWKAFVSIQLTVSGIAGALGIWLFYVQHQFDGVYWARGAGWDRLTAALEGSSFYQLPKILQWFTGNIGYHHIHHLSPRIANYHLERCHNADPYFRRIKPVTLLASFKSLSFRLWDERLQRFVSFQSVKPASLTS